MHLYQLQKHTIKDEIRKSPISIGIKPKRMLNEVSQEIRIFK